PLLRQVPLPLSPAAVPSVLSSPSLHDALPISAFLAGAFFEAAVFAAAFSVVVTSWGESAASVPTGEVSAVLEEVTEFLLPAAARAGGPPHSGDRSSRRGSRTASRGADRKSTRLNSSHVSISYAV